MHKKGKVILFLFFLIILVGSIIYNYSQIRTLNKLNISEEEICQNLQVDIYQISKKIEDYYSKNGYYPDDLQLFGIYSEDIDYQVGEDYYQITMNWDNYQISYQSQSWESPEDFMNEECINVMEEKNK